MRHNVSTQIKKDGGFLNQIYKTFINLNYISYSPEIEEEFEFYNTLYKLLKNNNLQIIIDEIKYRVTDGETLNSVFIDIINTNKALPLTITSHLAILYDIENRNWIKFFS